MLYANGAIAKHVNISEFENVYGKCFWARLASKKQFFCNIFCRKCWYMFKAAQYKGDLKKNNIGICYHATEYDGWCF